MYLLVNESNDLLGRNWGQRCFKTQGIFDEGGLTPLKLCPKNGHSFMAADE